MADTLAYPPQRPNQCTSPDCGCDVQPGSCRAGNVSSEPVVVAQAYELDLQEGDRTDWQRIPRRCADRAEATVVMLKLFDLYAELPSVGVRIRKVD